MAILDYLRNRLVKRNPLMIFALGFSATFLGVLTAYIVFPENVGLMGLAFASLILQPFLSKLIYYEEEGEYRRKRISRGIFRDHSQTFRTILLLFFGIMLAYSAMYLYSKEVRVKNLFGSQLAPYQNLSGSAAGGCESGFECFIQYIVNNLVVMIVVFILSSAYGAGAMLFLAWNASVWGTVFAFLAVQVSGGGEKTAAFLSILVRVLPHTLLEASAYFLAVIAGIVITKAYLKERMGTSRFNFVVMDGLIFFALSAAVVVVGAAFEAFVFPAL
ncbi:MAG TPA: stage II sporulation protein M [Candidatus Norongarragalinales archaeon]|nr:stage II sporulation protein M [Candidatus Norongarragalinales archaeon]